MRREERGGERESKSIEGLQERALQAFGFPIFPVYLGSSLGVLQEIVNFRSLSVGQSLSLAAGGAVMGFLGSLSSLARFLKI